MPVTNRKDIMLLLLYSPGKTDSVNEPIIGRTRLVKMLYLFKKEALPQFKKGTEIHDDNFYNFFAWNFGPFSDEVYSDITFFTLRGFIKAEVAGEDASTEEVEEYEQWIEMTKAPALSADAEEYREEVFSLTEKGEGFAKQLFESLSMGQKILLKSFKEKLNDASLRAILKYVYTQYPEGTSKSLIKDEILS